MKNIKEIIKTPKFIKTLGGMMTLGILFLTYQNIDLKNKNNYIYNEYKQTGEKYLNYVTKYNKLENKKYWDSITLEMHYALKTLQMQKEQINLIYENDSLWNEYFELAKKALESAEEKREIFEKLIYTTEEKEFYKSYASYLDSLLLKAEFKKINLDSIIFN